ncbi:hypothetical protein EA58_15050 [Photobacterium galatheae]|uniref:Uncharacterized protein n=1 Tax=Photobacterium galatheae TaxID=1654360 RepID=A0A066RTM8_9GAMM|nr:hypothetical protein EA58_15050 [Photobacterium galatheae]
MKSKESLSPVAKKTLIQHSTLSTPKMRHEQNQTTHKLNTHTQHKGDSSQLKALDKTHKLGAFKIQTNTPFNERTPEKQSSRQGNIMQGKARLPDT